MCDKNSGKYDYSTAILYIYDDINITRAVLAHLCTCAPVEPAHVGGVSEVGVDPTGDQNVALGLFILDYVVEV